MNKIIISGRLVRDCDVRYTTSGKVVCQFTLAVDRPCTNQDGQREADFINIVVWGKIAELCGNRLAKGHRALVEGRLQIRSYDGKDCGKRYVTEVVANSVEFLERKGYTPGNGSANSAQPSPMEGFANAEFDEEIPF